MKIRAAVAAVCLGAFAASPAAGDVPAGSDLLTTPSGQSAIDFTLDPIPMDFFGTGSDALTGKVALKGVPLVVLPLGAAQGADSIVERLQTAVLPSIPSQDTVDIEIVALHLQSTEPVTVTFDGGNSVCTGPGAPNPCCTGTGTGNCETEWQLDATLSSMVAQPAGSMEIRQENSKGGSFTTILLPVRPRLVFTRISGTLGTSPAILDPAPQIDLAAEGEWVHTDGLEGIYRDADSSLAVSAGDTRLSFPGLPVTGSAVAAGEVDIGTALVVFTGAEKHVDPIVNAAYDAGEGIYNDADLSGAVSVGDTRLSVPGFDDGSVVAGGDPDIATALVALTGAERHEDPNNNASYDAGEGIYGDADSSATVSPGDSRILLAVPGFPVGSVVAAGNGDLGAGLVAFGVAEKHAELIVNGEYDAAEGIYDDVDLSAAVSENDIRLSVPGLPAGSLVPADGGDVGTGLVAFAAAEKYADLIVVNGTYDAGEDIYDDTDASVTVSVGDSRLSGLGFPLGSVVASGNGDVGVILVAFNLEDPGLCTGPGVPFPCCTGAGSHDGTCTREMHADPNSNAAYDPEEGVYSDPDADAAVSVGDTRIITAAFLELESVVAVGDGDVGVALIPFAAAERHTDPDSNGMYDSGLGLLTTPGGTVDGDGDHLIDTTFSGTSNFSPGVNTSLKRVLTTEQAPFHVHKVMPPPFIPPAQAPLAVTLTAFSAEASSGRVTLSWSTESEIDNEGFNVLRSTASDGPGRPVNNILIPAQGSPAFGASYELVDDPVRPGMTYFYLLEDVSTLGERTLHGAGACTVGADPECGPIEVTIPYSTDDPRRSLHD